MTWDVSSHLNGDEERQHVYDIFTTWSRYGGSLEQGDTILKRLLEFLTCAGTSDASARSSSVPLNAQISVDSGVPNQLRLTLDPFAGIPHSEVSKKRVSNVARATGSRALLDRTEALCRLNSVLPQDYWIGLAPDRAGSVVKAYVVNYHPVRRRLMSHLAREAGWLPANLQSTFLTLYDRLIPSFATLEGIGISFSGDVWLGTTLYVRSTVPWTLCASLGFSQYIGISPALAVSRLSRALVAPPSFFGWAIEVDPYGALVDLKLEFALSKDCSYRAVVTYAQDVGIDSSVFDALAHAIASARLSVVREPVPAIMSLRFASGELRSLVSYFSLTVSR